MDDIGGIDDVAKVLEAAMGVSASPVTGWEYEEEDGGIVLDALLSVAVATDA